MSAKYFIDTNVFVYSFDAQAPEKKARSMRLIQEGLTTGLGIISTQVIQEFLNVATQKFVTPMEIEHSKLYLRQVLNPLCHVYPDLALYESCLEIQAKTRYSFYDSLILASALKGDCSVLYSEDLQDGQEVRGVKIINPYQ
jgi:predicted nucleic acid-binding protein